MLRALSLAAQGLGETSPNPSVGAVILGPDGEVVGEGRTAPVGGPHAEVVALAAAGGRGRGGTAVVTLEPCNHTGRTGPCTQALIGAGVRRVVIAARDPNPLAAGGAELLRQAGVEVRTGVREAEAAHLLRYWLTSVSRGRPYLIWKYAATLDGRSAAADGTSKWITSEPARADVHELRGSVDAIIAGIGTVLADDPALTVRVPGRARRPLRVVVDSAGRTPETARVRDGAAPTWIATAEQLGAGPDCRVDLAKLLPRGRPGGRGGRLYRAEAARRRPRRARAGRGEQHLGRHRSHADRRHPGRTRPADHRRTGLRRPRPAGTRPAGTRPAGTRPAGTRPADTRPADTRTGPMTHGGG
jgi:diaminohydroxyphosphoribosylaminopyrimidine deaminase/5-amino-6-(5-phosphoribosylamino)uracil reductase